MFFALLLYNIITIGCKKECIEQRLYEDANQDGLGDPSVMIQSCEPDGHVSNNIEPSLNQKTCSF